MLQQFWFFSFAILFISFSLNNNQCNSKEYIVWNDKKKLRWDYFQSIKAPGRDTGSTSKIQIKLEYKVENHLQWFSAECIFLKKSSFLGSNRTDYVLNHEQVHFDIGEVYARVLRKEILLIGKEINRNNSKRIDSLVDATKALLIQEQLLYDSETDGSQNRTKQEWWDMKIRSKLDSLSAFAKHKYWL